MESVRKAELTAKEEECLNLRSELGGSKLPGILVLKPKGTTAKAKEGQQVKGKRRQFKEGLESKEGSNKMKQEEEEEEKPKTT